MLPFVFVAAALIGLAMALNHFRGKTSPAAMGWLHGVFVIAAMILFLSMLLGGNADRAADVGAGAAETVARDIQAGWGIFGLFGIAALGGLYMFFRQKRDEPWPALVILAHGGVAVGAIVLLLGWLT